MLYQNITISFNFKTISEYSTKYLVDISSTFHQSIPTSQIYLTTSVEQFRCVARKGPFGLDFLKLCR